MESEGTSSHEYGQTQMEWDDIQDVTGLDNQAPAGPDSTGAHQGDVLGEGQLLGRAIEVGDTGDDQSPLQKPQTLVTAIKEHRRHETSV